MSNVVVFDNTTFVNACPPHILDWCGKQWGANKTAFNRDAKALVKFDAEWNPVCVAVLDNWTSANVCTGHAATNRRSLTPSFIKKVYEYAFNVCGANRMTFTSNVENVNAINMHASLGHTQEGILKDLYGYEKDGAIYRFLKTEWEASKWHPKFRKGA